MYHIKIEWGNYKQSNYDLQGNITSTIPLPKYLSRFQNFVDDFRGHPSRSSDLECIETLLAGINTRRYSYIRHKYYGNTAVKPTYSNLKAESLQSDKNQVALPEEPAIVYVVTSSSVPEPTLPVSLATTSSMDPLNPQLIPLQPLQCAMCGQMKATHLAGCPSCGVVCSACGLVGHKLVFCRKVIALKNPQLLPLVANANLKTRTTKPSA